jgi:hypothetical protein
MRAAAGSNATGDERAVSDECAALHWFVAAFTVAASSVFSTSRHENFSPMPRT